MINLFCDQEAAIAITVTCLEIEVEKKIFFKI